MPAAVQSREEMQTQINDIARARTDNFRVKVLFRKNPGAHPDLVLSVQGATAVQIAEPETWLPKLLGGTGDTGTMTLEIAHEEAPATRIAQFTDIRIGGKPRPSLDWSVLDDPEYTGPSIVKFPERPVAATAPEAPSLYSISRGATPALGASTQLPVDASRGVAEGLLIQEQNLKRGQEELAEKKRALDAAALQRDFELKQQASKNEAEARERSLREEIKATREASERALAEISKKLDAPVAVAPPAVPPLVIELMTEVKALATRIATPPPAPPPSPLTALLTPANVMAAGGLLMEFFKNSRADAATARAEAATAAQRAHDAQLASSKELRDVLLAQKGDGHSKIFETMAQIQMQGATQLATAQAQSITNVTNMTDMMMRMMKTLEPEKEEEESTFKTVTREILGFLGRNQAEEARLQTNLAAIARASPAEAAQLAATASAAGPAVPVGEVRPEGERDDEGDAELTPEDPESLKRIVTYLKEERDPDTVASLIVQTFENDAEFGKLLKDEFNNSLEEMFEAFLGDWIKEPGKEGARMAYAQAVFQRMNVHAEARRVQKQAVPSPRRMHRARRGAGPAPTVTPIAPAVAEVPGRQVGGAAAEP